MLKYPSAAKCTNETTKFLVACYSSLFNASFFSVPDFKIC